MKSEEWRMNSEKWKVKSEIGANKKRPVAVYELFFVRDIGGD